MPAVRDSRYGAVLSDQWNFITLLASLENGVNGSCWTAGFKNVNLHPKHRVPLEAFLRQHRMASHLAASEGVGARKLNFVKDVNAEPEFMKAWQDDKKEELFTAVREANWCVDTLVQLGDAHGVSVEQLKAVQKYINALAVIEEEKHLVEQAELFASTSSSSLSSSSSAKEGLDSYTLRPKGMKGEELFKHMVRIRKLSSKKNDEPQRAVDRMGLVVLPDQLRRGCNPSREDFQLANVLRDSAELNQQKLPTRLLNHLGELTGNAGVANDPKRINRMEVSCLSIKCCILHRHDFLVIFF
jgi:hypothetical protein